MNESTTMGIDLAKSVLQVHGVDAEGKVVLRRQWRRGQVLKAMAQLPACVVGMEACASAHYWARELVKFGHKVRLMSPQFVKPYRKSGKNDRNDAEAICEAVTRPTMRFVPVKTLEQQDMQAAHRIREALISERTALVNQVRGLLGEYGLVFAKEVASVHRCLPGILEDAENGLTVIARQLFAERYADLQGIEQRIAATDRLIRQLGAQHEVVSRLETIPGIAWLTATALYAAVGDAKAFKNGRQLAAWMGLVPRQHSSGGKARLLGISKRGDAYLRKLLVHGARSVTTWAERRPKPQDQWLNALRERRGKYKAYLAQANKTARIVWAVMARDEVYRLPATTQAAM